MNLYNANPATGVYEGHVTQALENPRYNPKTHDDADKYIYNASVSSLNTPPETGVNEAAQLSGGRWVLIPDYSAGVFYAKTTGLPVPALSLGNEPDDTVTDVGPPDDVSSWDESGGKWKKDPAKEKDKTNKKAALDLTATDAGMFAVLEDLIAVHNVRGDLTTESQALLNLRDEIRSKVVY